MKIELQSVTGRSVEIEDVAQIIIRDDQGNLIAFTTQGSSNIILSGHRAESDFKQLCEKHGVR